MEVGIYFNDKYFSENKGYIERISAAFTDGTVRRIKDKSEIGGLDVLFVLGGDGTILSVASACAVRSVKIIGVNYGHVGFLAEFEPDRLDDAIALVNSGKYKVQSRNMLKVTLGGQSFYALNDAVIQRSTSGESFRNTVSLRAEIDGTTVDTFSSDGLIVSTPTGSTAYSLAAGGSVLAPDIGAFILTPICSHSLHSRPVVFGDGSVIKITPLNKGATLGLILDGRAVGKVKGGEEVTVQKAEFSAEFITADDKNFFNKLLVKLNLWSK